MSTRTLCGTCDKQKRSDNRVQKRAARKWVSVPYLRAGHDAAIDYCSARCAAVADQVDIHLEKAIVDIKAQAGGIKVEGNCTVCNREAYEGLNFKSATYNLIFCCPKCMAYYSNNFQDLRPECRELVKKAEEDNIIERAINVTKQNLDDYQKAQAQTQAPEEPSPPRAKEHCPEAEDPDH